MVIFGKLLLVCLGFVLLGAGCVFNQNAKQNNANYPSTTTVNRVYYINKGAADNLAVPFSEWQKFYQKKYGWEFSYPEGWKIRTEKTDNQLLVFLSNVECLDQCPPEFVGFKMKVGAIYPGGEFVSFIKKQIEANNKSRIFPGGQIENIKISGRSAIKVARSDWTGAESGPGYYVGLDKDYYAYISTGRNNLTKNAEQAINQLIGSIKIYSNSIPRPSELEKIDENNIGEIDTGDENLENTKSVYTSRRYKFTLNYPERCYFSDMTDQTGLPIVLELAVCGSKPGERIVGVRVFDGKIDQAWNSIVSGRNLNFQMQNVLVSDQAGRMYSVSKGAHSRNERWLLLEKFNRTYIIYTIDDSGRYANDFDWIVSGFQFN